VLIIGGSAAGITAAVSASRYYPDADILLIRKEERVLIPCGIPYIFGTVGSPDRNLIPDTVLTNNNVELMVDEVVSINRDRKTVETRSHGLVGYEKLVLATGSLPLVPQIPGVELGNVFAIRKDVQYLQRLQRALDGAEDLVIIGGGFIGLEFADECKKRGVRNVSVVELLPHCLLLACDEEICLRVEAKLSERGVNVLPNRKAKTLVGNKEVKHVELENGQKVRADVVILGVGVRPNTELAGKAGLRVEEKEGIYVDEFMRTSDENVFAVGDCTRKRCFFTGRLSFLRLASIGTMEGRVAGANL